MHHLSPKPQSKRCQAGQRCLCKKSQGYHTWPGEAEEDRTTKQDGAGDSHQPAPLLQMLSAASHNAGTSFQRCWEEKTPTGVEKKLWGKYPHEVSTQGTPEPAMPRMPRWVRDLLSGHLSPSPLGGPLRRSRGKKGHSRGSPCLGARLVLPEAPQRAG